MMQDNFKPTWIEVKRFTVNTTVAIVQKSDHRRPRYSIEVQFIVNDKGESRRHHTVRWTGQGQVQIEPFERNVAQAFSEAEYYVAQQIQGDEGTYLAAREERDLKQAKYGQPVTRHTGKTERNRNKVKVA